MIALSSPSRFFFRVIAPFVWRNEAKVAAKLEGFAATEAGSALDMLKAAELTDDPKLRHLFFRHAMDEARHARLFREHARQLTVDSTHALSEYNLIHATRQNLFEKLGLVRFIAFVYLAEKRGALQFRALREHFRQRPELEALFARIGKDEQFHVSYSGRLLRRWSQEGQRAEIRRALWSIRFTRALDAWRRSGRVVADLISRSLLGLVYLVVLPVFAVICRFADPEVTGWKKRPVLEATLKAARRQF